MDKGQAENAIAMDCSDNIAIPTMTANLETLTIETNSLSTESKRVLRKRKPRSLSTINRRCSRKPKQRISSKTDEEEIIRDYYLDKSIKRKENALETIFEESDNVDDNDMVNISTRRFKRMLMFSNKVTTAKQKKRHAKTQEVFGKSLKMLKYKKSDNMQTLLDKLSTIRETSPMKIDSELK